MRRIIFFDLQVTVVSMSLSDGLKTLKMVQYKLYFIHSLWKLCGYKRTVTIIKINYNIVIIGHQKVITPMSVIQLL